MAFTPLTPEDKPTLSTFNAKFLEAIASAVASASSASNTYTDNAVTSLDTSLTQIISQNLAAAKQYTDEQISQIDIPSGGGGGLKVVTGSYRGTGTHGLLNTNTITFDSPPKLILIVYPVDNDISGAEYSGLWIAGSSKLQYFKTQLRSQSPDRPAFLSGSVFSWYSTKDSDSQLNNTVNYNYLAILE